MGEHATSDPTDDRRIQAFMRALLRDVQALEQLLEDPVRMERGIRRIGAEQELFLVDDKLWPNPVAPALLAATTDKRLTTELAQFNIEANLSPLKFGGKCLSAMEAELNEVIGVVKAEAAKLGSQAVMAGILPTLRQEDLTLENMTPKPRYHALNRATTEMAGGHFHVIVKGLDELDVRHDNVMLEACNTSFQIHFQVAPEEFARLYNLAQVVTAPVLSVAVNSPLLLGKRLWRETRVALFERSLDARTSAERRRGVTPRVSFGRNWIRESVAEIFKEDISRYRVLLGTETELEDPFEVLKAGGVPDLTALRLHNGTVYRWNRPCYGTDGKVAHLRIENRALPAGPTVVDEVANAAFFYGLMAGGAEEYGDVAASFDFDDAHNNFTAAARHGLKAQFTWFGGEEYSAPDLIRQKLLPLAREGLLHAKVDRGDIDRYLAVIEARVHTGLTGAEWAYRSLTGMRDKGSRDGCQRALVGAMIENQIEGKPCHEWPLATLSSRGADRADYQTVGQFMTTNLFTVRPGDLVNLAASVMDWEHVRHVPVEDKHGAIVGLVTHRGLLRLMTRGLNDDEPVAVRDIMKPNPVTVSPSTPTREAIELMRTRRAGCLPVVEDGRLVGIVTESDLIRVAAHLLDAFLEGGAS